MVPLPVRQRRLQRILDDDADDIVPRREHLQIAASFAEIFRRHEIRDDDRSGSCCFSRPASIRATGATASATRRRPATTSGRASSHVCARLLRGGKYAITRSANATKPIVDAIGERRKHQAARDEEHRVFLRSPRAAESHARRQIERDDEIQLALRVGQPDERRTQPRRHVPVDPAHVVAGHVRPVLA